MYKGERTIKVWHFSDIHGRLEFLTRPSEPFDLVVVTGDVFPNLNRGEAETETKYQRAWLLENLPTFLVAFQDTPVLWVPGNHDYYNPSDVLTNVCFFDPCGMMEILGAKFAGFREIPYIAGEWNGEVSEDILAQRMHWACETGATVLVTHTPPYGILAEGYGSRAVANGLAYRPHSFKTHLYGHAHFGGGESTTEFGMTFYNGACASRVVDIEV